MPETFRDFSADERKAMAAKGEAMPDGGYPIPDKGALRDAIQAIGRASNPAAAKRHIIKRARALGASDMIPEGWSMSADDDLDYVVAFAGAGEANKPSEAFPILAADTYRRGARTVEVTEADLDEAVRNFARWRESGAEVPVDYDHSFDRRGDSTAAGWYDSIFRKGSQLMATVRWTAKAVKQIADGEYRFFSPEFTKSWRNERGDAEGFTILAGALTNRPFLRGMTPVALSQEVEQAGFAWAVDAIERLERDRDEGNAPRRTDTPREVPDTLTIEIDGKEEEFSADRVRELVEQANESPESFSVEIDGESHTFSADEIRELREKAGQTDAANTKVEALTQRTDRLEARDKDRDFSEIFDRAQREGRVNAADETRELWRETFDEFGSDKTKALLEQIPAESVPVSEQGRGTQPGPPGVAKSGVDAERYAMDQKIQARADEKGISYVEAMDQLVAEGAVS